MREAFSRAFAAAAAAAGGALRRLGSGIGDRLLLIDEGARVGAFELLRVVELRAALHLLVIHPEPILVVENVRGVVAHAAFVMIQHGHEPVPGVGQGEGGRPLADDNGLALGVRDRDC